MTVLQTRLVTYCHTWAPQQLAVHYFTIKKSHVSTWRCVKWHTQPKRLTFTAYRASIQVPQESILCKPHTLIVYALVLVLESQCNNFLTFSSLTLWHHHVANTGFILLKKKNNPRISPIKWVANIQKRRKYSASASTELKGWSFVWWSAAHSQYTNCCSAKPGKLAFTNTIPQMAF